MEEVTPTTSVARREESMEAPISALGGAVFKLPVKLDGLLRHGYMLPKGAEDEIPLIKRDLEEIIAILQDHVSRLDYPSVMVNCWMKEVRELSYDIEDYIDQYEHAADSKSKYVCKIPRHKFTLCNTNRLSERLKQRLWMANKIREFSVRVQEARQRHKLYILGGIGCTPPIYDVPFRSPHHIGYGEAADLVGIDALTNKLEELLIKDGQQKLKVVSIVGVGGIGKTTLANEIYCKLGGQFDCQAFVRFSQKPDMRRLLASMLSQVRPHQLPDSWKVHNLIADIRTHLQDKRYLIVVDDVWATSTWDILNCALPDDNICSRILITTEIEDAAHKCCGYESKYVFMMKPLGDDDSRKLFFNSLFGSRYGCPPELREVSNNIIRKCGSVPLAIVTIAGLLASQVVKLEQWDYVNKSLGYGLRTNIILEGMKQVLNLSYNNLPSHLKACMLYLSIYEDDYIIWKDDLVKQWIAEGFLCSTEEQDKDEIFGSYFDELVSRRMIQPIRINDNGEILSCVVHHMVLKLIAYKSLEENFVIAIDHSQTTTRFADKVRRLALHFGNTEDAMPPTNMRLSQVRTLAFFGLFKCLPSIVVFRLLQVLILHVSGDEDSISFDLTRISELFRLRYLHVTCNVTLELRTQMRGLQCLETLKIDAKASAVPSDIVHLSSLLHLNLPAKTNLPNGIDRMTQLRTLGYFDLSGNSIENVQSLGELTNLQDLQLTCYTVQPNNMKNNMQCLGSILGKLSNLKSLTLVPAGGSSCVNILDDAGATSRSNSGDGLSSVSSPPALIQRLELSLHVCIFSTVPMWIGLLGKLCILKIGVRELARSDVDVLRGLPALTVLSLYVHTKPTERVIFDRAGFSVLKYFKFRCSVAWLKFEAGAMPNLRKLKLGFNAHRADRYSTTMPIGIEHLSGLTEISAKIGSNSAEEPDRRSAESALSETIKMHPGRPNFDIQCVDRMFGDKDDESMGAQEEEHMTAKKQWEIMEDESIDIAHSLSLEDLSWRPSSPFTYTPAGAETGFVMASNFVSSASSESQITTLDPIQGATSHKKRKQFSERSTQVRLSSAHVGSFLDDGFSWRKYYQHEVPGAKHPRSYYRCTHWSSQGCPATKQVQCTDGDPLLFDVVYRENHTCTQSTQPQPGQEQNSVSVGFNAEGDVLDSITTLDPIQGATPRMRRISLRVVGAAVRWLIRMRRASRFHIESANEGEFRSSLTTASAGTSTAKRTSSAPSTQGSKGKLRISDHESSGTQEEEHMTLQTQCEIMEDESNEQHGVLQKDYREDANKLTYIRTKRNIRTPVTMSIWKGAIEANTGINEFVTFFRWVGSLLPRGNGTHDPKIEDVLQLENGLQLLTRTLRAMDNLIERAEWKSHQKCVAELLRELKDAIYDADDLLDEFRWYEQKMKVEDNVIQSPSADFFNTIIQGSFSKVKDIMERLKNLSEQLEKMGLPEEAIRRFDKSVRPKTSSFLFETRIFGRDTEVKKVMESLGVPTDSRRAHSKRNRASSSVNASASNQVSCTLDNNEARISVVPVLPIFGIGGVGKTFLAQHICDKAQVMYHFDPIIWICVSDDFDEKRLTKEAIQSSYGRGAETDNLDSLQKALAKKVKNKRFLLILDDMWEDSLKEVMQHWKRFCAPLTSGLQGSMMLVTTRFREVADRVGTMAPIPLEGLKDDDFWKFFKLCAFGSDCSNNDPELESIGRSILPKLKGSPLAANTLGRLLQMNLNPTHWNNILKSELWKLEQENTEILPALHLSYIYLPFHLKRCFSFCAVYPKYHNFEKHKLAEIWVAEGFVKPQDEIPIQDTGCQYFEDLVNRSFFQKVSGTYVIHDLLHDMAQLVSRHDCFVIKDTSDFQKVPQNVRHMSILSSTGVDCSNLLSLCKHTKLRTLLCNKSLRHKTLASVLDGWCSELRCMRVMFCAYTKELPDSIGNLKHLRYLEISRACPLKSLPSAFCCLYNLQVIHASKCKLESLPNDFSKLLNLQVFELSGFEYHSESKLKIDEANKQGSGIRLLKNLNQFCGDLSITNLHEISKDHAAEAELKNKKDLNGLLLEWSSQRSPEGNEKEVLQVLQPPTSLKSLCLWYYPGESLPSWFQPQNLPNLRSLEFRFCHGIEGISFSSILQHINLNVMLEVLDNNNGSIGTFSSMTDLTIYKCNNLSLEQFEHMPAIKRIRIGKCGRLVSLPTARFGDCLEELEVINCPNISQPGESFGSFRLLKHLVILDCPRLNWQRGFVLPPSLERLYLRHCGDISAWFPCCLENLNSLVSLKLCYCACIESIPGHLWRSNLASLQELIIMYCPDLVSIGGAHAIANIERVCINGCTMLEQPMQPVRRPTCNLDFYRANYSSIWFETGEGYDK